MKKFYAIVILIAFGITQIYARPCFQCNSTTKAFSIGTSTANGNNSFAGGNESEAMTTADNSFVFGDNSFVIQTGGIAIGSYLTSNALNSLVFGTGTSLKPLTNSKPNSLMFGVNEFPSLTIVKPPNADLGYVGIGTEEPEEMVHVVGKVLIDRTGDVESSLQFRHPNKTKGIDPGDSVIAAPYLWDIYSDTYGLKFNTIINNSTSSTQYMVISGTGRVGIGTTTPKAKLHVDHNFLAEGKITTLKNLVFAPEHDSTAEYWEISRTDDGLKYTYMDRALQDVLFLGSDGLVGVGKTNPSATLDVNGSFSAGSAAINGAFSAGSAKVAGLVCAKEVRVALSGAPCWPDYVFSKDYNLRPILEVEQFIAENQHLPNVPSAAEVEANGIELGEMNAILLQKIEELTLYIIQMEKRLAGMEKIMVND